MIADAVQDRAHAVLADAEVDVATGWVRSRKIAPVLDVVERGTVQVSAPADQDRHRLGKRLECFASGFAGREFGVVRESRDLR